MSLLHQINEWGNKHHPKWLVAIRVVLGFCLFIKGFGFIRDQTLLSNLITQTAFSGQASWLATVIPWVHLLGGSLIIVGLLTRLSVLAQIPILIGAVFFVNVRLGLYATGSDLLFSIIILLLLIFFLIEGGGPISLDSYFGFSGYKEKPGISE